LDQLFAGKYNSLRQFPYLAARLRQNISPAEAAMALQALLRPDEFDQNARVELFYELAFVFERRSNYPADATDGVADEQFLCNVAEIIYRTRMDNQTKKIRQAFIKLGNL
jgi:hypothetical protein